MQANNDRTPKKEYESCLTELHDSANAAEIDGLRTYFVTDAGTVKAVDDVSFDIPKGRTVCAVGESGCGKSVTGLSIMRLLNESKLRGGRRTGRSYTANGAYIAGGEIRLDTGNGVYDVTKAPGKLMQKLRGGCVSMIFQEPMTSLNPVFRIGRQLDEASALHNTGMNAGGIKNRTLELLETVGIADASRVYRMYPHQLSGGMRQRVMCAMALAGKVRLLIADEPTTALDVTVQAQILKLISDLRHTLDAGILLITHDLGVVKELADSVVVMYAGRIVERGSAHEIFTDPRHPYTVGLMRSRPDMQNGSEKLYSIPGSVPVPIDLPDRCRFLDRCERAHTIGCTPCRDKYPPEVRISDTHYAACYAAHIREEVR